MEDYATNYVKENFLRPAGYVLISFQSLLVISARIPISSHQIGNAHESQQIELRSVFIQKSKSFFNIELSVPVAIW